jgi:putative dimethyl sulfoxide reductase chaperone
MDIRRKDNVIDGHVQMALSRAGIYRLLGRLFRSEIDEALLEQLQSSPLRESLVSLGFDPLEGDRPELLQVLAEDYTQLFIGPGKHLPPYASAHKKIGEGLLNGLEAAALRRFIMGTGFEFVDSFTDFPDHISAELEYMETLVQHEHDALLRSDTLEVGHSRIIQKNLFDDFLDTWIPQYCERVKEKAGHALYQQLADCTSDFLAVERNYHAATME